MESSVNSVLSAERSKKSHHFLALIRNDEKGSKTTSQLLWHLQHTFNLHDTFMTPLQRFCAAFHTCHPNTNPILWLDGALDLIMKSKIGSCLLINSKDKLKQCNATDRTNSKSGIDTPIKRTWSLGLGQPNGAPINLQSELEMNPDPIPGSFEFIAGQQEV